MLKRETWETPLEKERRPSLAKKPHFVNPLPKQKTTHSGGFLFDRLDHFDFVSRSNVCTNLVVPDDVWLHGKNTLIPSVSPNGICYRFCRNPVKLAILTNHI